MTFSFKTKLTSPKTSKTCSTLLAGNNGVKTHFEVLFKSENAAYFKTSSFTQLVAISSPSCKKTDVCCLISHMLCIERVIKFIRVIVFEHFLFLNRLY